MRSTQIEFFKKQSKAYGGELLRTRKGRATGRPLDTKNTMHMVLRSTKAKGDWSFKRSQNDRRITEIVMRFSKKYGVRILSLANAGNHLHFQIKLSNRHSYRPFVRAITAAIAMAVTGASRWSPLKRATNGTKLKFWDYRPFTRVISGLKNFLTLNDYIQINALEGFGYSRKQARFLIEWDRHRPIYPSG